MLASPRIECGGVPYAAYAKPQLVADCVSAMGDAVAIPVTVKCRTGIQFKGDGGRYQNSEFLLEFVEAVHTAGCQRLYLHARNILGGLTLLEQKYRHCSPSAAALKSEFRNRIDHERRHNSCDNARTMH